MTARLQTEVIKGKENFLEALKLRSPIRIMTPSKTEIPDRAWYAYAGVYTVEIDEYIQGRRLKEGYYEKRNIKAVRFLHYLGWGNIGQLFFPIKSIDSLEGDLITFNDHTHLRPVLPEYPQTPSGSIDYKTQKDFNKDYRLLKQSGVLG